MGAIITNKFRRNSVATLIADSGTDYYIGIGKTDAWPDKSGVSENSASYVVDSPTGAIYEGGEVLSNLISMTKVDTSEMRYVVPKVELETGRKYKTYDVNDADCFFASDEGGDTHLPCYAYYPAADAFYVCLRNGPDVDPVDTANIPTLAKSYEPESLADGYIWVYIEDLETNTPFDTAQYQTIVGGAGSDGSAAQALAETGGMLYGFAVQDGGSAYDELDIAIVFVGTQYASDGITEELVEISSADSAGLSFTVDAGVITQVELSDPTIVSGFSKGLIRGSVMIKDITSGQTSAGVDAKIIPLIAPEFGFGYHPIADMPTFFIGLAAEFDANNTGDAQLLPYRQISLIQNPTVTPESGEDALTADCLPWFDITGTGAVNLSVGDVMELQAGSGDEPTLVYFDSSEVVTGNTRVYFHQNYSTSINQGPLPATGTMEFNAGADTFIYTAISEPEWTRGTGEVLFIENRKPIVRSSAQNEKIKLIVQY